MKKIFIFIIFFLSLYLFSHANETLANGEFYTNYNVLYEVTKGGKFHVTQNVSLTNKLSNVYATEYSFTIEKSQPQNISAHDSLGPIEIKTLKEDDRTTIKLKFNDQVVGKDKVLKFSLSYELADALHRYGQVREIILPKITQADQIDGYFLTLKVPSSFGKPAHISPEPLTQKEESSNQVFAFDKNQLNETGVIAVFGDFQVFNFVLTYHLQNPTGENILTKTAFPPDTTYQKLTYQNISPPPLNMEIDLDGNWLGTYLLKGQEKIDILTYGQVKLFSSPQESNLGTQSLPDDLTPYLQPQNYWEVNDPQIQELSKDLKTPQSIYDFVVKKLEYDYKRINENTRRLGAKETLSTPERAICMEYTDLFIALSRAAGIPARELAGFAYTDNPILQPISRDQDVLHAWPEYWNSRLKRWVQIDPTWGDTTGGVNYFSKLDLGHFVFAIHGRDSVLPLPAGAYKNPSAQKKDVEITFGKYEEQKPAQAEVKFIFPETFSSERTTEGLVQIINNSSTALYNQKIQIEAEGLRLVSKDELPTINLPPYGHQDIEVNLASPRMFASGKGQLRFFVNQQQFEYNLNYESFALKSLLLPTVIILFLVSLLIFLRTWATTVALKAHQRLFHETTRTKISSS